MCTRWKLYPWEGSKMDLVPVFRPRVEQERHTPSQEVSPVPAQGLVAISDWCAVIWERRRGHFLSPSFLKWFYLGTFEMTRSESCIRWPMRANPWQVFPVRLFFVMSQAVWRLKTQFRRPDHICSAPWGSAGQESVKGAPSSSEVDTSPPVSGLVIAGPDAYL